MKDFAVIGTPVGHSLSPILHNELFRRLGIAARTRAVETLPVDLAKVAGQLRGGSLAGINITLPHKSAFIAHLDELVPEAEAVGAVNCVTLEQGRLVGHNTDVTGLVNAVQQSGFTPAGRDVLVMGAGGAARAAVVALQKLGARGICIAARKDQAWQNLCADLQPSAGLAALSGQQLGTQLDTTPFQLLINATPVGMWPHTHTAPLLPTQLHKGQTVLDMVYHPEETRLLDQARARDCQVITGLAMFVTQALASLEIWFPGLIYDTEGEQNPRLDIPSLKVSLRMVMEDQQGELASKDNAEIAR